MADVEAELRAAHEEMWRLYRDAWESEREADISPALFARLLAEPDRAEVALTLIDTAPAARASLTAAAAGLSDEQLADAAPSVLTVVAGLLPDRVDARAIAAQNARLAARALGEARDRRPAEAYLLMQHLFQELPWDEALHTALLARAAELGMMLDPTWPRAALSRAQEPAKAATALTRAIWEGWGEPLAREVLAGYLEPLVSAEVALPDAAPPEEVRGEPPPLPVPASAPEHGSLLVAVAVGEHLVVTKQIKWKRRQTLTEVVRPALWRVAVAVAHGGAPEELPAPPESFSPDYRRYEDLESVSEGTPVAALHPLYMIVAIVPMEGRSTAPEQARRTFEERHESLIRQWRQVAQKTINNC